MKNDQPSTLAISREEFRKTGYSLVDAISDFLESIEKLPVTTGETPEEKRKILPESLHREFPHD